MGKGAEGMKFKINYTVDGQEDSFIIEGETIDEIRKKSHTELEKRNGKDPWSEHIS
jgi:hypothetical protein